MCLTSWIFLKVWAKINILIFKCLMFLFWFETDLKLLGDLLICTRNSQLFTHLKIVSHFQTLCTYCSGRPATGDGKDIQSRPGTTLAAAGRSYRETIRDAAGNNFTPKPLLKLNFLLILYLKVWHKIVYKSWKSKKSATQNNNVLWFKALIINKTFLTMLGL
jgi:hypothetical protein